MYRLREIIKAFSTLVGWQDTDTLSQSDSGLYFQEAHPLLTLRAMRGIMPKDLLSRHESYVEGRSYGVGDKVEYIGKCYISLIPDNYFKPSNTDGWKEYDLLEDYLSYLTNIGIKKVLSRFFGEKVSSKETKSIVDRRTLFDGTGRKEGKNPNNGRLVGFEFVPTRSNGVTTTLNKIGLQFIGNVGFVKLYLFHSSQVEPIATKEVNYTSDNGSFMWFDLNDWVLPYVNDSVNAGGSWYVVYNEASLPDYMQSINFGRDWSREPCGTCNKGDAQLYRAVVKNLTINPFYVATTDWNEMLWDIDENIYTNTNNYGMNFMITMSCDITDSILAEKFNFAAAIQLQVAHEALRSLALNPEVSVNRVQYNADRDNILFELNGNGQGIKGLAGELEKAFKVLEIDTKNLDPICLGCTKSKISYGSI